MLCRESCAKVNKRIIMNGSWVSLVLIFCSALFDSYAAYIVKRRFNTLGSIDLSSFANAFKYIISFLADWWVVTAVITFVAAPALWFIALNRIHLSVGYPLLVAFHLIFVLVFGIVLLNEHFTFHKGIGCNLKFVNTLLLYK